MHKAIAFLKSDRPTQHKNLLVISQSLLNIPAYLKCNSDILNSITNSKIEYYVQLYSAFKQMDNPKVCYVEDAEGDPYTGLFIIGSAADGETVYAQALLTQT